MNRVDLRGFDTEAARQIGREPTRHGDDRLRVPRRMCVENAHQRWIPVLAAVLCVDCTPNTGKARRTNSFEPRTGVKVNDFRFGLNNRPRQTDGKCHRGERQWTRNLEIMEPIPRQLAELAHSATQCDERDFNGRSLIGGCHISNDAFEASTVEVEHDVCYA